MTLGQIRGDDRLTQGGTALARLAALEPLLTTVDEEPAMQLGTDPAAVPVVPIVRIISEALVLPELFARHGHVRRFLPPVSTTVERLAKLLVATDPAPAEAMIRRLYARAGSLAPLCATVLEPAARALGDLWRADVCGQLAVTLGLGRLQATIRQLTAETAPVGKLGLPVVLVAPQPGEPHMLGAALDAELLWQAGWETHQEFPATEDALQATLADTWFDVLDLALSPAMVREDSLPRMAETIAGARAASKNPALTVVASGRAFFAECEACTTVGADASTTSALQAVLTVTGALQTTRTKTAELTFILASS